ncbi:hypothetical protein [Azospirillum sp. sgz302134]
MRRATFAPRATASKLATLTTSLTMTLAAASLSPAVAATVGVCQKPGVPVCMDDSTTFVSADKMAACQFEVKEYVDRTMDYLKCLNDENTGTGQELTRNVERFNCRLAGGRSCG